MDSPRLALQQALTGRFTIERELGRGGMGIVYLARDLSLDRPVAIKLLEPALAGVPAFRERFLREARAAARLSHPHIVAIHGVEDHGALVFFVMAYVDGETLGQRVRRGGPLPRGEALRLAEQVGWAIGHAHAAGIVHRDIKPDNILLERGTGRALVTDFGIARVVDQASEGSGEQAVGTPAYMSPEQVAGGPVDGRSDLYSLAASMHFALTGSRPFEGDAGSVMRQHLLAAPPDLASARPDLPARAAHAIARCLAKRPDERFATAEEFVTAVGEARGALLEPPPAIAVWVREANSAGREIGPAFAASAVSLAVLGGIFGFDSFAGYVFLPIATLLGGIGLVRFGDLVMQTRQLRLLGYDHASVQPALHSEAQLDAMAATAQPARPPGLLDRPRVILAAGLLKTGLFVAMLQSDIGWVSVIGAAGTILMPTATLRQLWSKWPRARGWWSRLLQGRVGRWVFRLAGVGQAKGGEPEGRRTGGDTLDRLQALHVRALGAGDGLTATLREADGLRAAVDAATNRETPIN